MREHTHDSRVIHSTRTGTQTLTRLRECAATVRESCAALTPIRFMQMARRDKSHVPALEFPLKIFRYLSKITSNLQIKYHYHLSAINSSQHTHWKLEILRPKD